MDKMTSSLKENGKCDKEITVIWQKMLKCQKEMDEWDKENGKCNVTKKWINETKKMWNMATKMRYVTKKWS